MHRVPKSVKQFWTFCPLYGSGRGAEVNLETSQYLFLSFLPLTVISFLLEIRAFGLRG